MAYLKRLQYKFDSTITIEHAGIKKKEKKMKCLNFVVDFFLLRECNCLDCLNGSYATGIW